MDLRFVQQRVPGGITTLDVIELYNCHEEGYAPGEYTVADVDPESGGVTLVGCGRLAGYVAMICLGSDGSGAESEAA